MIDNPISKFLKTDYLSAKHMLNNNIMYPLKHHPRKLICKEVYVQHPSKGALMGSSRWIGINLAYINVCLGPALKCLICSKDSI